MVWWRKHDRTMMKTDGTMMKSRWRDSTILTTRCYIAFSAYYFLRFHHRAIVFASSYHRVFTIMPSRLHHRTIIFSPSCHRIFTIVPSRFHCRTIALSPTYHHVFIIVPSHCHHRIIVLSPSYQRAFTIELSRFFLIIVPSLFHHRAIVKIVLFR
jgi:hypothetical protein